MKAYLPLHPHHLFKLPHLLEIKIISTPLSSKLMSKLLTPLNAQKAACPNKWSLASNNTKQEADTRVIKGMVFVVGGASSTIKMEATMMESGRITKCTVGGNSTTKEES